MSLLLGIIGWPVEHSRSPAMHRAAIAALGLDASYLRFAVPPARLAAAIEGMRALGIDGLNVTIPHKQAVIPLLDEISVEARAIGAVNTIARQGDRLLGSNTDAPGLVRALGEAGVALQGASVVLIGAGGAARAAAAGLAGAGAAKLVVVARRAPEAARMIASMGALLGGGCSTSVLPLQDGAALGAAFARADLVIQATSATLGAPRSASEFAHALPLDRLPAAAAVVDLVYEPRRTAVLERAEALGLQAIDGLGMLLWQGALSLERWTGREAPIEAMRRTLLG